MKETLALSLGERVLSASMEGQDKSNLLGDVTYLFPLRRNWFNAKH